MSFDPLKILPKNPDLFIICLGEEAKTSAFQIAHELRSKGFQVERDYEAGSMKSQMRKANKAQCQYSLIIGENELRSGKFVLKNMETGEQKECSEQELASEISRTPAG